MHFTARRAVAALALLAGLAAARPAAAQTYKIVPFDPPATFGSEATYYGINDFGTIVGNYSLPTTGFSTDGLVYQNGAFADVLGPTYSPDNGSLRASLQGENDFGVSVGGYVDPAGVTHGFTRAPYGAVKALPDPAGATLTVAFGINNFGLIVGRTADASSVTRGFLYAHGKYTLFAYPGSNRTFFTGVNDEGLVVGRYRDAALNFHSFLLQAATLRVVASLDVPGAVSTSAEAINDVGQVVGSYTDTHGIINGFLRQPYGTILTLDVPDVPETDIYGINNEGVAVGTDLDANGNNFGLLFVPQCSGH